MHLRQSCAAPQRMFAFAPSEPMASRHDPAPSNAPRLTWPVALLYAFLRTVGLLPLPVVHALGAALGHAMWLSHGRARRIAERNLSLVITQDDAKRRHAARASVVETGK